MFWAIQLYLQHISSSFSPFFSKKESAPGLEINAAISSTDKPLLLLASSIVVLSSIKIRNSLPKSPLPGSFRVSPCCHKNHHKYNPPDGLN